MKFQFNTGEEFMPVAPEGHPEEVIDLVIQIETTGNGRANANNPMNSGYGVVSAVIVNRETDQKLRPADLSDTQLSAIMSAATGMAENVQVEIDERGVQMIGLVQTLKGAAAGQIRPFDHRPSAEAA